MSDADRPHDSVTDTIAQHSPVARLFGESALVAARVAAGVGALKAVVPREWSRRFPVILPILILLITGFRGLDFGVHWDERFYQIGPAKRMVSTGILLPGYYGYPSFDYWVELAALLPEIPDALSTRNGVQLLTGKMDRHPYLMRLRAI